MEDIFGRDKFDFVRLDGQKTAMPCPMKSSRWGDKDTPPYKTRVYTVECHELSIKNNICVVVIDEGMLSTTKNQQQQRRKRQRQK